MRTPISRVDGVWARGRSWARAVARLLPASFRAAAVAGCLVLGSASAQEAQAPAAAVASETKGIRDRLEGVKIELEQKEAALRREGLTDAELQRLRAEVDPALVLITDVIGSLAPRLDGSRARLEQLGPKPKPGDPEESGDVRQDRAEREAQVAQLDETHRVGRALLVQAEQIAARINDRRRALFTGALFERNAGLFSPGLWTAVAATLPQELRALAVLAADAGSRLRKQAHPGTLGLIGLALGVAIALFIARFSLAPSLIARDPAATDPSRRHKILAALAAILLGAGPIIAGSLLVYFAFDLTGILPPRLLPPLATALSGLALVAFLAALADALLAPGRPAWRLLAVSEATAARTAAFVVGGAGLVAAGKAVESLNHAIAAALPITVATRGLFALGAALLLAAFLRRSASAEAADEECLGPYVPTEPPIGGPARIGGWAAVTAIVACTLTGFVALASFLVDQIVWVGALSALLFLGIRLSDELVDGALRGETRVATAFQANTGLHRRSLEQIAVLAGGVARVLLVIAAILLALAPWGVESTGLLSSVRAALFGFRVGEVSVSLSTVVIAGLLFAAGFAATRAVQRWLDRTFLPTTDLDAGLRNSISTVFGYLGIIVAGAIAFSYLGLSLDRIAIVAGALSVGIGFGLQSIVNNFVSGLILLWERPIRVGDLVVVGDGEGYVRRINVRATEIETFDRSTVIVPNSNLISGVVKNRVRADRIGRVVLPAGVLRNADPARVAQVLVDCARAHPDVLPDPPPLAFFRRIGDPYLEFELVCFVGEVEHQLRTLSDLNHAVHRALSAEGLIPPYAPTVYTVQGLAPVESALQQIAEAIAEGGPRPHAAAGREAAGPTAEAPRAASPS
jgi:potassium-dependent mechanosensitive channel